jgi:chromate reductase
MHHVLVISGSTRTGSYNQQLAGMVVEGLLRRQTAAEFVDLRNYPMQLFDPDLEASHGPPGPAHELRTMIGDAAAVVIVSPEYNGAMTPLIKNTMDWISRVDMATFLGKKVVLMAASPGRGGGAHALALTSTWLRYIGADIHPETFGLPSARHTLVEGALLDGHEQRLEQFLDGVVGWL